MIQLRQKKSQRQEVGFNQPNKNFHFNRNKLYHNPTIHERKTKGSTTIKIDPSHPLPVIVPKAKQSCTKAGPVIHSQRMLHKKRDFTIPNYQSVIDKRRYNAWPILVTFYYCWLHFLLYKGFFFFTLKLVEGRCCFHKWS